MPMLEALVRNLDRAAATLRGPRPYAQEPLNAFRLSPAQGRAAVEKSSFTFGKYPHGSPKIDLQAAGRGGGW